MNYGKKSTQKREKELTSKSTMIRKKFYVIFCKSLLVCVFAVMVIGACSGVGVIRGIIASAPTIDDIVATPTGFLSTVLDANGNQTATLVASGSNRRAVTIDEIPKNLQHAFVAIEDERFYEHNGIDVTGIIRAGVKGVASTGDPAISSRSSFSTESICVLPDVGLYTYSVSVVYIVRTDCTV